MPAPLMIGGLLAGLLSSPEALAEIRKRVVDGIPITEHIDEDDSPCGNRGWQNGCYQLKDGEHHVWYYDITPDFVKAHEISHAKGMRHTAWQPRRDGMFGQWMNCATVIEPAPGYDLFDEICVTSNGETKKKIGGLLDLK